MNEGAAIVVTVVLGAFGVIIAAALCVGAVRAWPLALGLGVLGFIVAGHVGALAGVALAGAVGLRPA